MLPKRAADRPEKPGSGRVFIGVSERILSDCHP